MEELAAAGRQFGTVTIPGFFTNSDITVNVLGLAIALTLLGLRKYLRPPSRPLEASWRCTGAALLILDWNGWSAAPELTLNVESAAPAPLLHQMGIYSVHCSA